jgi:Enoyl-(Acyl carrier protein) reductase
VAKNGHDGAPVGASVDRGRLTLRRRRSLRGSTLRDTGQMNGEEPVCIDVGRVRLEVAPGEEPVNAGLVVLDARLRMNGLAGAEVHAHRERFDLHLLLHEAHQLHLDPRSLLVPPRGVPEPVESEAAAQLAVAPGVVSTAVQQDSSREAMERESPMGRPSTVEDVADAVMYLSDAPGVTGDILYVDGGSHLGRW